MKIHPAAHLRTLRACGGFTLVEVLVAMSVCVLGLVGIFAAAGHALRIVGGGREIASASQLLQQRMESFRQTTAWANVTTAAGITTLLSTPTATAANFVNATETVAVEAYPAGGTPLIVRRLPGGAISSTGASLSAARCVKFTVTVARTGMGNVRRTREMSTIITKRGL